MRRRCCWSGNRSARRRGFRVLFSTLCGALFGWLALRASGIGFLMITLALGQIVWGIAYRANTLTDGDNGCAFRPAAPLGLDIARAEILLVYARCVRDHVLRDLAADPLPFGAAWGARDQPRTCHAWAQCLADPVARFRAVGLLGLIAGLLYVYYNLFISPHAISLQQSAEVLLMAILGGASTFLGPIVGAVIITLVKNVVSSYVDRWNTLLGAIFVIVILFMPFGIVPGVRQLWARLRRAPKPEGSP
jgi:branched-chain amino acid transport system permease protein